MMRIIKRIRQRCIKNLLGIVAEFLRIQRSSAGEIRLNSHEFSYETRCSAFLLIAIGLLMLPSVAFGQDDEEVRTIPFDGVEILCHVLHNEGASPLTSFRDAFNEPRRSVIIMLGNPKKFDEIAGGGLATFVQRGGNLLVATDYRFASFDLGVEIPGVRFAGHRGQIYHDLEECPFLSLAPEDERDGWERNHPIFHFLSKGLATNCPSTVHSMRNPGNFDRLLDFTAARGRRSLTHILGSPKDAPPSGRCLFIAGHGIFMNGMMLQPDNDNFSFATNAVRWLRDGPDDSVRPKVLLMVDGEIITDFDMKLTPPPPPIPIPTVRLLNQLLRGLEQERVPQRIFSDLLDEQRGRFIGVILAIATIVLLIYGTRKLLASRESADFGSGPTVNPATASVDGVPLYKQRRQALLRGWDFAGEAKVLAADWVREVFGVTPNTWHDSVKAEMRVSVNYWSSQLQKDADWVLQLASSRPPAPMTRADFMRLMQVLRQLSVADRDGRLVLLVDGKNVRQT